jgi:hypothetical protein
MTKLPKIKETLRSTFFYKIDPPQADFRRISLFKNLDHFLNHSLIYNHLTNQLINQSTNQLINYIYSYYSALIFTPLGLA